MSRSLRICVVTGAFVGTFNPRSRVMNVVNRRMESVGVVLRPPPCREPTSVAGATVEGFPHDVEVAGVAGGFFE